MYAQGRNSLLLLSSECCRFRPLENLSGVNLIRISSCLDHIYHLWIAPKDKNGFPILHLCKHPILCWFRKCLNRSEMNLSRFFSLSMCSFHINHHINVVSMEEKEDYREIATVYDET
ncbi:hypothetical protein CEXT_222541 [Caerostris extrusa]|uniref:Ycf15 n=1 Tax=Caerostris extrusa TaxID=172846 RepID=A0AAV4NYL2_CAEEX|nr:hypothetical protein CEXT_222541 [Caerostris extrusa]